MLKTLIAKIFNHVAYVQVWEDRLKVVDMNSGKEFDQPPFMAVEKNNKGQLIIKAIGTEAKALKNTPGIEVTNPFSHPRQLVSEFLKAEKIIQHSFQLVFGNNIFSPCPRVVIQPMEKLEGGLTEIEIRVFRELCAGAGAREVKVYVGSSLVKQGFDYKKIKSC